MYRFAEDTDPNAAAFEAWMELVDEAMYRKMGVGVDDLPDAMYHDYFDEGMEPDEAVEAALECIESYM